jgi:hypothetical protein
MIFYGYWFYFIFICSINNSKNKVIKKDLFSQKFNVPVTLPGFFNTHSVAGIPRVEKDDPPVVVVYPPNSFWNKLNE